MLGLSYTAWLLPLLPTEAMQELDGHVRRYQQAEAADKPSLLREFAASRSPSARMVAARYSPADQLGPFLNDSDVCVLAVAAGRPGCPDDLLIERLQRAVEDHDDLAHGYVGPLTAMATSRVEMEPAVLDTLVDLWIDSLAPEQVSGDVPLTMEQNEQAIRQLLWRPELSVRAYSRLVGVLGARHESDVTSQDVLEHLAQQASVTDDEDWLESLWHLGSHQILAGLAANPRLGQARATALLESGSAAVRRGAASNAAVPTTELHRRLRSPGDHFLFLVEGSCEHPDIDEETLTVALSGLVDYDPRGDHGTYPNCFGKVASHPQLGFELLMVALPTLRSPAAVNAIINAAMQRPLDDDDVERLFTVLACDAEEPAVRSKAREHADCPEHIVAFSAAMG